MNGHFLWETDIEPAGGTPNAWFDTATGVTFGSLGNLYVSGWAATERITSELGGAGTPLLVKVTSGGGILWAKRAPVHTREFAGNTDIAARGDRVVITAPAGPGDTIHWGSGPAPDGWLGSFDTGGGFHWGVRWDDGDRQGAIPDGVVLNTNGTAWVVSTRRDVGDRGYDVNIRRYTPNGAVLGSFNVDQPKEVWGTGIALGLSAAFVSGYAGGGQPYGGGKLWKIAA
jgi:hypothetical protein